MLFKFLFSGDFSVGSVASSVLARSVALVSLLSLTIERTDSPPARPPPDRIADNHWYVENKIGRWYRTGPPPAPEDRPGQCWYGLSREAEAQGEKIENPCGHWNLKWINRPVCRGVLECRCAGF
jgi:hypothetical protein